MARATATCTCSVCGHAFEKITYRNNRRDADSWVEWAEKAFTVCPECEQKAREKKAAQLAADAKADGLPELVGSPKQIAWAEQLRSRYIESSGKELDDILMEIARHKESGEYTEGDNLGAKRFEATRTYILTTVSSASWWIDNRNSLVTGMEQVFLNHRAEIEGLMDGGAAAPAQEPAKAEAPEAPAEELLAPEDPKYGEAVVAASGDKAEARYPAKDDAFRTAVKSVGFKWDGDRRAWVASASAVNGPAEDRAAEAIANLLRAGFPVRCKNAAAREKAITGEYIAWTDQRVTMLLSGKYAGWIYINLPGRDDPAERDNLYAAAKKIRGAVYDHGSLVVPVANHLEVEDFAGIYGYRLSPAVAEAAAKYEASKLPGVRPADRPMPELWDKLQEILRSSDAVLPDLVDDHAPAD